METGRVIIGRQWGIINYYSPDSMAEDSYQNDDEDEDDLITSSDFSPAFDILLKLRRDLIMTVHGRGRGLIWVAAVAVKSPAQ